MSPPKFIPSLLTLPSPRSLCGRPRVPKRLRWPVALRAVPPPQAVDGGGLLWFERPPPLGFADDPQVARLLHIYCARVVVVKSSESVAGTTVVVIWEINQTA